jgi:hypothetical protein
MKIYPRVYVPSDEEIQRNSNTRGFIHFEWPQSSKIDNSTIYPRYKIGNMYYPLTEYSPKIVHHSEAITLLNSFKKSKSDYVLKFSSLSAPLCIALAAKALFNNINPLTKLIIAGGLILLPGFVHAWTEADIKLKMYKNIVKTNLTRKKDDPGKLNALVLMAMRATDDNNALFDTYYNLLGPLAKKHNIDLYYPLSVDHISKIFKKKKYDHLLICCHGDGSTISFTPSFNLHYFDVSRIKFNLNKNAIIALDSCSAGKEGGIARRISSIAQKKVFAPQTDSQVSSIELDSDNSIKKYSFYELSNSFLNKFFDSTIRFFPIVFPFFKDVTVEC